MKQALDALLESLDDVQNCLNQDLQFAGYPRYDKRIEFYKEQIAKHEKAIIDLSRILNEQPAEQWVEVEQIKWSGDKLTAKIKEPQP